MHYHHNSASEHISHLKTALSPLTSNPYPSTYPSALRSLHQVSFLRSTKRSKFPSHCEVYKALFFLHDNLVQNSPTEQGRKHLPKHVSMITDSKSQMHTGSAGKRSGGLGAEAKENTRRKAGRPSRHEGLTKFQKLSCLLGFSLPRTSADKLSTSHTCSRTQSRR